MTTAPTPTFRFREIAEALGGATTVSVKDSALVVIDVQNFYLPDNMWPVHDIAKTNKVIDGLVEKYREVSSKWFPIDGQDYSRRFLGWW